MARIGEGDNRWIVRERDDGRNCNSWHWTSKDISPHVKQTLGDALRAATFAAPLELCQIKSAEVSGEASVNNRKGRTFLVYDLEVKLKWEAELRDSEGLCLETCKGSLKLPDVNATMLDDLDVEFTCKTREGTLPTAMRKQGSAHVRKLVETCMNQMQDDLRRSVEAQKAPSAAPAAPAPAPPRPLPQPIKIETGARPVAPAPAAAPAAASAANGAADSDEEGEASESDLPAPLVEALAALRSKPEEQKLVRLSNCGIKDHHLKPLMEAMHHSQCATEELDLAFNRLTDAGLHLLCKSIASGCALELTKLHVGGNKTSIGGMALAQQLKQVRSDLIVNFKQQLQEAASMMTVTQVYGGSPAARAGLARGDSIVAFGPLQQRSFKSVSDSVVPLVKENVGKPIDVVVVRMDESGSVQQVQLSLTPHQWSGGGLLGCILK